MTLISKSLPVKKLSPGSTADKQPDNFAYSDGSCTDSSDEDQLKIRNSAPSDAVTQLIIQGLKHNGADVPASFAPFVDKSRLGSLPMKPVHQPVVGYKSRNLVPKKPRKKVVKRPSKPRKPSQKAAVSSGSDSDSILIGSDSSTSTSGQFVSVGSSERERPASRPGSKAAGSRLVTGAATTDNQQLGPNLVDT